MCEPKLRLNIRSHAQNGDGLSKAAKTKRDNTETMADAWARVNKMSFTKKDRELFEIAYDSYKRGEIGRLKEDRFTKGEAIEMGRIVHDKREKELREKRIKETLDNKPVNYYVLTKDSELPQFLERLREEVRLQRKEWSNRFEVLGVDSMTAGDFEGTGIDSYIDLSIGFSIWLPILEEGYYLAYGHAPGFDVPYAFKEGDPQLTRSTTIEAISSYLSIGQHGKSFHMGSARYDMHIAENDGYTMRGVVWDTLDAMHTMYEHEESFGLKPLIQKYGKHFGIDGEVYSFEDLFGNRSPAPFNTEIVGIYAINDVKFGWSLFEWQFEIMRKTDRLLESYSFVDKDLPETDVFLERCGFRLDFAYLRELEAEFEPEIKRAEQRVFDTYGIDAEFIRKMDRTINVNKIKRWIEAQEKRIKRLKERIKAKEIRVKELEDTEKTHTKMYENEVEMLERYRRDLSELAEPITESAPQEITEFSLTNHNHIGYLIYDHLKIEDKTHLVDKFRTRSTAADVLEYYYEDEPALEPLATVAEYTKLLSTYIRPYLGREDGESAVEVTGRLHSNFRAGGTRTGRYSSRSYNGRPKELYTENVNDNNFIEVVQKLIADERRVNRGVNLQNIPARSDNGRRVRRAFIPRDGWIFVGSDLGQIEPRIMAHIMYTKYDDNSLRQIFVEGLDLYTTMAMRIFKYDEKYCVDDAYDPTGKFKPRDVIKTGILAKSYGQSVQIFARNVGIPLEEAENFFTEFDEQFPSFTQMASDILEGLKRKGFVETLYGRKRRFPEYKKTAQEVTRNERKLMGYYIERKRLRGQKKTPKVKARLKRLEELIKPLADKRNLVRYWERAAFNAVIQGTGADILKRIGNRFARICMERGWEFNASIHDEAKISLPIGELDEEVIELVHDVMTKTTELSVPLVTDTVIEERWGEEVKPEEYLSGKEVPQL